MILSLLALLVVAVTVLGLLVGVTVVPFVRAVDMAERRGFSTARWGWLAGLGSAAGLLLAAGALRGPGRPVTLVATLLLAALLAWAVPLSLAVIGPHQTRLGGRAGAHER